MELLEPTRHWVADRSSARRVATAMLVGELKRGRLALFGAAVVLGLTALFLAAGKSDSHHDPVLAFLFSLGLTAFLVGCAVGISHLQRRKVFRSQLPAGLELTSRFGPDYVVVTTPGSETRMEFDSFSAVEVEHGWVFLTQRHRQVRMVFPRELFAADDLARLRMVVAGYQPREPDPPQESAPPDEPDGHEQSAGSEERGPDS